MVPSPRRLPHTISPQEGAGFEPSVPLYGELGALGRVRRDPRRHREARNARSFASTRSASDLRPRVVAQYRQARRQPGPHRKAAPRPGRLCRSDRPSFACAFHQPLSAARDHTPRLRCPIAPVSASSQPRRPRARRGAPVARQPASVCPAADISRHSVTRSVAGRVHQRRSKNDAFPRWREMDSNPRSPALFGSPGER
jgi:hypothetical protein